MNGGERAILDLLRCFLDIVRYRMDGRGWMKVIRKRDFVYNLGNGDKKLEKQFGRGGL